MLTDINHSNNMKKASPNILKKKKSSPEWKARNRLVRLEIRQRCEKWGRTAQLRKSSLHMSGDSVQKAGQPSKDENSSQANTKNPDSSKDRRRISSEHHWRTRQ